MKEIHFNLVFNWERDLGYSQVSYFIIGPDGQRLIYCLQKNGPELGGISFVHCTLDQHLPLLLIEEEDYSYHFANGQDEVKLSFERPPINCETTRLVNLWIDEQELK